jgi:type IV secretory pathway TrbD component
LLKSAADKRDPAFVDVVRRHLRYQPGNAQMFH